MAMNTALLGELKHEAANTKKMLARVPADKLYWRPHEKSSTLGKLAKHIAELPMWFERILNADEFNFATATLNREPPAGTEEILQLFDERLNAAITALENVTDENLNSIWVFWRGEQIMFQMPKKVAVRTMAMNHLYHHRGQLSVYLRLLNVPVPGMYGPSADEAAVFG
ncbi:DinB family protein [Parafilimonas sp.]|uniref:DinB family protein n=1 Tax=Parafilimonas sp. TaxID=1969739 RepID=UPI0039E50189